MKYLQWAGPILDLSGYSAAGRGYLRACESVGILVRAKDRSRSINLKNKGIDQPILDMYARLSANKVPDDCPCVQHQVADQFFINKKSKYSIGYTIFELTGVPNAWVTPCNQMDVIWTGSDYSKQAFQRSGVTVPIETLPHALDLDLFCPGVGAWKIANRRKFAFLSVMDLTDRKAWREMLQAYWRAFRADDDVCLILKAYFGGFDEAYRKDVLRRIALYKAELRMSDTAPILVYGHDIAGNDMPGLYAAADCYVSISREGFGLASAEAMACGLPCIGPSVGGTRQFMTPENSFLVDYVGDAPISQEVLAMYPSFEGLSWACHSIEHLTEIMRKVVLDEEIRKKVAARGMDDVRRSLSHEAIGRKILSLLPD